MTATTGAKIEILNTFRETEQELPKVRINSNYAKPVYFVCGGVLYMGSYNIGLQTFRANLSTGWIVANPYSEGYFYKDFRNGACPICTHWCYVDELKLQVK